MPAVLDVSPELRRFALLREFKLRRLRAGGENLTPFSDRVSTTHSDNCRIDLAELHKEVRDNIIQQIEAVHRKHASQVVLLSGEAGTGKTHILRHFAQPALAEELSYIFVGGSNDWVIDEFQYCLLDWMISALTQPLPTSDHHLLLERIQAIGFRALDQLLKNRTALKRCLAKRRRGLLGRIFVGRRASQETIEKLTAARNPEVFLHLDFSHFTDEVCRRFLAEPGNPVHRYAFRVLLTYLFPDEVETGIGTRDRVLNWFRRKPDDGYWLHRLGVADDLTKRYAVADAIKLLIHLFSPDLSSRLSVDGDKYESRVFMFVFDQAEGREELFEDPNDWNQFFAHLSELYNTLPNVLILFTMTLKLRNEKHPMMERQFRDRIRQDERFVLRQPTSEQIQALYRARLSAWLSDEPRLWRQYQELAEIEQYLPLTAEKVKEIGGLTSARAALERFDPAFGDALRKLVVEPGYDFEYVLNEEMKRIESVGEYEYTSRHLDTVRDLLGPLVDELASIHQGVRLNSLVDETLERLTVLRLDFDHPEVSSSWVCVYLTRFGSQFNPQLPKCEELLYRKQNARYSLWMVRPRPFEPVLGKPEQMHARVASAETEARLKAAIHLLEKQEDYKKNGTWEVALKRIQTEIDNCYLGELFKHARARVMAAKFGGVSEEPSIT